MRRFTHSTTMRLSSAPFWPAVLAMICVIVLSNYLVQFIINDWLTWGAFSFPLVFLVTDLTNRVLGAQAARKVAWCGLLVAATISFCVAPWRIALASASAFIASQMLDIHIFNKLRSLSWWKAPLFSGILASIVDTAVFFFIAFAGTELNWVMLTTGDLSIKWLMALVLLAPYRFLLPKLGVWISPVCSGPLK